MLDKNIFINNIQWLMKRTDTKAGDLEKAIEVSQGYLSKLFKSDSKQMPSIEVVTNIANQFKVTLDDLVTVDLSQAAPAEQSLRLFLNKLYCQTKNDEIFWETLDIQKEEENYQESYAACQGDYEDLVFDFQNFSQPTDEMERYGTKYLCRPLSNNLFGKGKMYLYGDSFYVNIGDQRLYLLSLGRPSDGDPVSAQIMEYTALILENSSLGYQSYAEVLDIDSEHFDRESRGVERLYRLVRDLNENVRLSKKARSWIDDYVNN